MQSFDIEYKKLNKAQKETVDTTEGPVMVIAGPGTGKTQVLALRIANILTKTDTTASGILCLTFTRAGVHAMRKRLESYIGNTAHEIHISTFHSFAADIIEKYFEVLDIFDTTPQLLDDKEMVFLVDEILHTHDWKYLRPRSNPSANFNDLKSLISILKRERMSPQDFLTEIENDIDSIKNSPESISSRGPTKGFLKKEAEKKVESLERTREVVLFYEMYEKLKLKQHVMDYEDVLEYAVRVVELSDDARDDLREQFLYVLVDEHQDSSGVQNSFLRAVWQDVEKPNIFVVGDDRQLIYGFGGASLSYFEDFKQTFGRAHLITLTENYRSTAPILSLADTLLVSALAEGKLTTNRAETHAITLSEYSYPRDEIIGAGLWFKEKIQSGIPEQELALLVPKNKNIKTAIAILRSMGLYASGGDRESFFDSSEASIFRRILSVVVNPFDNVAISKSLFDVVSGVQPLEAHTFLHLTDTRKISLKTLLQAGDTEGLFKNTNAIYAWGKKLSNYIEMTKTESLASLISHIGNDLFINSSIDHDSLVRRTEIVRTMLHLVIMRTEKNPHETLSEFLAYLDRIETYGTHIPVATIESEKGIRVLTLHASKGLEFEAVWIAHMNEETFMSSKRIGFTLPEKIEEKIEKKDVDVARRELYVAITRAKVHCVVSYAQFDYTGRERSLARVISEIGDGYFVAKNKEDTTKEILSYGVEGYVQQEQILAVDSKQSVIELVGAEYSKAKVSVTLLNNFFECPWKWYFRNFLRLPEVKNESLIFGSAVHKALETVVQSKEKPKERDIKEIIFDSLSREGLADERRIDTLTKEGVQVVMQYTKDSYDSLSDNRTSERSVSVHDDVFPHLSLYGKIDLTERESDDSVVVTDFKTGSSKTSGVIEKKDDEGRLSQYLRQLAMYSYLIQSAEHGTNVTASRLFFLEADIEDKNRIYETYIGKDEIELLKRDILDYDSFLKSGKWIDRTCNFKPYGTTQTECEHCALARRIYNNS